MKERKPKTPSLTLQQKAQIVQRMREGCTARQAVDGFGVEFNCAFRYMRDAGYRLRYITDAEARSLGIS